MDLNQMLDEKNMTKYSLSKASGVPKTTVIDICAGRSSIDRCSAKTVQQLARALGCTMEEIMQLDPPNEQLSPGLPKDKSYLECGLPGFLQESLNAMKAAWKKVDNGEKYLRIDCDYCNLQSDINSAEVNGIISSDQAWYLREKYLRIERGENS
ncbi:helix-turn-helix transcriptional regulator [Blautia schinkii]|nr:helix-turn-helix transcriptional regulator [Blautia schinkii]